MPIYLYRPTSTKSCEHCDSGFEVLQKLSAAPLCACPECDAPAGRCVTAPHIASASASLAEKNIADHGFTQYRKLEKGVYEKTAGKGPKLISSKD